MDLRFFAGQILSKTEIGKNLSILPARLDKLMQVTEFATIGNLLSFKDLSIPELYSFDPESNTFRLEYQDREYLARASSVLNPFGVRFKAEFIEETITEFGISYVGIIRIHHPSESFDIKVPGELSYDPACMSSDKIWVDFYQVTKIVAFVAILVKAALLGATKKFLKRLFTVIKPIISRYYQKEELFRWMYSQVKRACIYKKQPLSYGMFLQKVDKRYSENVQYYLSTLEMLKRGDIQELLPPPEFFKGISLENEGDEALKKSSCVEESKNAILEETVGENQMPTVREMLDSLIKIRGRYEESITNGFKKIQELENRREVGKIKIRVSAEKSFYAQCPVF